jgi:E3 ubiquitin-protein ligase NEDD4
MNDSSKIGNTAKYALKSSKLIDKRTGKSLSLEVQSGYVFDNQEDEDEVVAAISAYRASGGCAAQLRSFMDGFWDLIGRKDTFKAYSQDEVRMFIGGVSELQRFVADFFVINLQPTLWS